MIKPMNETEIVNYGLNWVRGFDEFTISGNHYIPYPNVLKQLLSDYDVKTEHFGPSDQGSTVSTFNKKKELKPVFVKLFNGCKATINKSEIILHDGIKLTPSDLEDIFHAYNTNFRDKNT